ncbi:MAG TPA: SpoIID/LytB domain-containing protein [bacterium]|jgi:stage II sporulation protein D|nr:SpoIID/LytB domain-containing protein [bacterium]
MGFLPSPQDRALWAASDAFRSGDSAAAAADLDPWVTRSAEAAREDLALRFLSQDYEGVLALDAAVPKAASDDEARLWVARSDAALARWNDCLARLAPLTQGATRPWALCLRAEALAALADPAAQAAFSDALSATAGTRLDALCSVEAAEEAAGRYDWASEETLYLRAERADPAYTRVDLRLAELYLCEERWSEARLRLERAHRVDPLAAEPAQDLDALLKERPQERTVQQSDLDGRLKLFDLLSNPVVQPLPQRAGEPSVRVGLLTGVDAVRFRVGGAMVDEAQGLTLAAESSWVACEGPGETWTLAPLDPNPAPARVLSGPLRLRPLDPSSTFGLFGVEHGGGYFFAGSEDRYYRGLLEISERPDGLLVVDELGLESYLCSVVPSEVPASWSAAALRAQAITARTFAWGELGDFKDEGYDLCPSVACAAYSGVGVENARTTSAVTATAGLVMESGGGRLGSAHFMDNSGGHTLPAGDVWSSPDPDSVGVPDCPDRASATLKLFPLSPAGLLHYIDDLGKDVQGWPDHEGHSLWRWTLRLTPEDLAPSVDRHGAVGRPVDVQGLDRSQGGYLLRVRVVGDRGSYVVSGDRIRSALKGLKSDLFYVEARLDAQGRTVALLFHGGGWGHGVGMSQSGAEAMAQAGLDERSILRHYFPEDRIHRRYTW